MDDNDRSQKTSESRQLLEAALTSEDEGPAFMAIIGPREEQHDLVRTDVGVDFRWVTDVRTAVFQSLGAASVCWENPGGAGEFDSTSAAQIGEALVEWLYQHGFPRQEDDG